MGRGGEFLSEPTELSLELSTGLALPTASQETFFVLEDFMLGMLAEKVRGCRETAQGLGGRVPMK